MTTLCTTTRLSVALVAMAFGSGCAPGDLRAEGNEKGRALVARPGLFKPLTEPPCSYCVNQNRKGLIQAKDPVVAWVRGAHNGGAIPLRHFLAGPRVINDTYGLFFFDPDGGYVAAYKKDYGYEFHGWRGGVLVVKGPDGTLWSALTGVAIEGPKKGRRLERVPSMTTTWEHWLMLHPESTAYDLFDGQTYAITAIPTTLAPEAKQSMGTVDARLGAMAAVHGVEVGEARMAFPLDEKKERDAFNAMVGNEPVAVLAYGLTRSSIAFSRKLGDKTLTFYADEISPETAPFKDKETGTRWTLAGRGIDGPLRGQELTWIPSLQCRWYAWVAENPKTDLFAQPQEAK